MRALIGIVKQRPELRQMGQPSQDNRAIRRGPNPRGSGLAGLARRGARRSSLPPRRAGAPVQAAHPLPCIPISWRSRMPPIPLGPAKVRPVWGMKSGSRRQG
jgi:hypothetical protein